MPALSRFLFPGMLLLGGLTLIAAAPVEAQDQDPVIPFPDFCFASASWFGEQEENGCYENQVTYSKWVDGVCTDVSTDCHDYREGGSGDDVLRGYRGDDYLDGNGGDDVLRGGGGDDNLIGGENDDVLHGGRGDDFLSGGAGDDVLKGGRGDDFLTGGAGDDVLKGGQGADDFWIQYLTNNGSDKITDFEPGADLIALPGRTVNGVPVGYTGFDALSLSTSRSGDDTILDLSEQGGGRIRLKGIVPADLSAEDFAFPR